MRLGGPPQERGSETPGEPDEEKGKDVVEEGWLGWCAG